MINCAACDDDKTIADTIICLIKEYSAELACTAYTSPLDLRSVINSGKKFDFYILDIVMPGLSGLDLARDIHTSDADALIIFLTGSDEYHKDAFELEALQYLDKPIDKAKLFRALDRVVKRIRESKTDFLPVQTKNGVHNIEINQIIYVEASRHVLTFHLKGGNIVSTLDSSLSLEKLSEALCFPPFCVPYRGFIINLNHTECLQKFRFTMTSGAQIPIPKKQFSIVRQQYADFLLTRYPRGNA